MTHGLNVRVFWQGGWHGCWLARFSDVPCDGRLVRAHLVPQQLLKRELRTKDPAVLWDERTFAPACGGPTGIGGCHGRLDGYRLTVPRADLPPGLEDFCTEHDLTWWLTFRYGPLPLPDETRLTV